jgi:hypothetical protein
MYTVYKNLGIIICEQFGHPLQGIWASLGLAVIFFIPCIVGLILYAVYYRRSYRQDHIHGGGAIYGNAGSRVFKDDDMWTTTIASTPVADDYRIPHIRPTNNQQQPLDEYDGYGSGMFINQRNIVKDVMNSEAEEDQRTQPIENGNIQEMKNYGAEICHRC